MIMDFRSSVNAETKIEILVMLTEPILHLIIQKSSVRRGKKHLLFIGILLVNVIVNLPQQIKRNERFTAHKLKQHAAVLIFRIAPEDLINTAFCSLKVHLFGTLVFLIAVHTIQIAAACHADRGIIQLSMCFNQHFSQISIPKYQFQMLPSQSHSPTAQSHLVPSDAVSQTGSPVGL